MTSPTKKATTAVVVMSWDSCNGSAFWPTLNADWSEYGSTPISIDYNDASLCGTSFTLADLEASNADVVILDDPSGAGKQFTSDEVSALQTYAQEGHDIIGTYLTFYYDYGGTPIDNTALAPLFGLQQGAGWQISGGAITPTYALKGKKPKKTLFRDVPNPCVSTGYDYSQEPGSGAWSKSALDGAKLVGLNSDASAGITLYKGDGYSAIFIANMPEYNGGTADQQFFYNAIVYPRGAEQVLH